MGGNPRKKHFWQPILNKFNARLIAWKGRFLSLAGRICLIKLVFTTLPIFYLSFFKAPASVCKSITSIQRRFLWGWGKDNRAISWVSWENLCKSKDEGGLGLKNIRKFNYALLAKWRWCLVSEEIGKWRHARFVWEFAQEEDLLRVISEVNLNKKVNDVHVWGREKTRLFTVKSMYECLVNDVSGTHVALFKHFWKSKAMPNVLITASRVLMDRMPTRVRLIRRRVATNTSSCAMY